MTYYNIVITKPAESDLQEIADYIAKELKTPTAAKQVIAKIGSAIIDLEQMPLRNALVSDEKLASQGIRKQLVDNFIVFYVVSEWNETVTIIRILSGRRNWLNLL